MTDVEKLFTVQGIKSTFDEKRKVHLDKAAEDAKRFGRVREDRQMSVRRAHENVYFASLVKELRDKRRELRGNLTANKPETIGRFQVLDELIERIDGDLEQAKKITA